MKESTFGNLRVFREFCGTSIIYVFSRHEKKGFWCIVEFGKIIVRDYNELRSRLITCVYVLYINCKEKRKSLDHFICNVDALEMRVSRLKRENNSVDLKYLEIIFPFFPHFSFSPSKCKYLAPIVEINLYRGLIN